MEKSAEQEIAERQKRMAPLDADRALVPWLRELTNEMTLLREELRRFRESSSGRA